jgi:hypothetical protein
MPFSNSVSNFALNSGNTPLLYPSRITAPAAALGTNFGISFPDQFLGRAISLKITNLDSANACFYDYNLNGQFKSLAASSFDTIDNTIVNYLTIQSGAAAGTLVEAQILPAARSEVPVEVMV